MNVLIMEKGKRYKIVHLMPGQKHRRYSVATYMGLDYNFTAYVFDQRPVAGTTTMHTSWVISAEEVPTDTPTVVNKRML